MRRFDHGPDVGFSEIGIRLKEYKIRTTSSI